VSDRKSVVRCECGYEAVGDDEAALVDAIRRHAWVSHRTACTIEEALAVILRSDLDASGRDPSA